MDWIISCSPNTGGWVLYQAKKDERCFILQKYPVDLRLMTIIPTPSVSWAARLCSYSRVRSQETRRSREPKGIADRSSPLRTNGKDLFVGLDDLYSFTADLNGTNKTKLYKEVICLNVCCHFSHENIRDDNAPHLCSDFVLLFVMISFQGFRFTFFLLFPTSSMRSFL